MLLVYLNYITTNTLQVCDNCNQCSCNVGFTGTSCEEITGSGTVNSGMYCVTQIVVDDNSLKFLQELLQLLLPVCFWDWLLWYPNSIGIMIF